MTTFFILAQVFSIIMVVFIVLSLQVKDKTNFYLLQIIGNIFYALSFMCLNAWTGFALLLLATIRMSAFLICDKMGYTKNLWVLLVFEFLFILTAGLTFTTWLDILPAVGTCIFTYGAWQNNRKIILITAIILSTTQIIYNSFFSGYVNIAFESATILSSAIAFIKILLENPKHSKKVPISKKEEIYTPYEVWLSNNN